MNFLEYLQTSAQRTEDLIKEFLSKWENEEVKTTSPQLAELVRAFNDNCLGGKRLRGTLARLGYEMVGGALSEDIFKVSAAVEIFQTAILAHDDIIDLSPTRRGKPTLYRQLGGDHYGISQTIALGDIGFFICVRLIAETNFSDKSKNKALLEFSKMFINTGLGEILDVKLSQKDSVYNEADVLTIHRLKTAYYTIIYPLKIGVILGDGDEKLLNQIEEFGENLGIAFQLQDDILGVFGEEKTLGKSVTSDIEEGKNTLLITEALKNADSQQKEGLERLYGNGKITKEGLEEVKKIFIETKSLEYSQNKLKKLVEKSKKVIKTMEIKPEYKDLLGEMADFIISRSK